MLAPACWRVSGAFEQMGDTVTARISTYGRYDVNASYVSVAM